MVSFSSGDTKDILLNSCSVGGGKSVAEASSFFCTAAPQLRRDYGHLDFIWFLVCNSRISRQKILQYFFSKMQASCLGYPFFSSQTLHCELRSWLDSSLWMEMLKFLFLCMCVPHQLQNCQNPVAAPRSLRGHGRTDTPPLPTTRRCSTQLTGDSVVTDTAFQAAELFTLVG